MRHQVCTVEPQFLSGTRGQLFCMYYPPAADVRRKGSILYIHPFAEEMNKSRRMAALQSRQFAAHGYSVLQPDLYGCGDSAGDFADATWGTWQQDLSCCLSWLRERAGGPSLVWGLRGGALLAAELAQSPDVSGLVLWHPVTDGSQMLREFLRLRVVTEAMNSRSETIDQLRDCLARGSSVEVAGYEVTPALAAALEQARLLPPPSTKTLVNWFDIVAEAGSAPPRGSRRIQDDWRASGHSVLSHTIVCEQFWRSQLITLAPVLIRSTTDALIEVAAAC